MRRRMLDLIKASLTHLPVLFFAVFAVHSSLWHSLARLQVGTSADAASLVTVGKAQDALETIRTEQQLCHYLPQQAAEPASDGHQLLEDRLEASLCESELRSLLLLRFALAAVGVRSVAGLGL